jgi:tight adherence protein B
MNLDSNLQQLIILAMVALAVGGFVLAVFLPVLSQGRSETRLKNVVENRKPASRYDQQAGGRLPEVSRENRRKQVQQSLKLAAAREKGRKKRVTLRMLIAQSGADISLWAFWLYSAVLGAVITAVAYLASFPWYLCALCGFVGFLGLPRWVLGHRRKRRQEKFLSELPDALDIMVRGLRSGLPLSDALKVIASETPPPIGPEFNEVVEGQRVGITIDQGLERMFERLPLQEVNFLAIVLSIQSKTGGNLTEALSNLSKVLRDRRKMKSKIRAVSQEAKSSAAIIGALPFVVAGGLYLLNPEYLAPLFNTQVGNILLGISAAMMLGGILVMRKMINFEI